MNSETLFCCASLAYCTTKARYSLKNWLTSFGCSLPRHVREHDGHHSFGVVPDADGPAEYRPAEYWQERLADGGLRATGHHCYGESYNRWLYRAKGRGLRWAARGVPAGTATLDVGSGNGWVVSHLLAMGMTVEACDIAPVAVERLGRRWPGLRIEQVALGADPLPWPDG